MRSEAYNQRVSTWPVWGSWLRSQGISRADKDGKEFQGQYDTFVLSLGVSPEPAFFGRFSGLALELQLTGKCNNARGNIAMAVFD
jgi:hypothetical protein